MPQANRAAFFDAKVRPRRCQETRQGEVTRSNGSVAPGMFRKPLVSQIEFHSSILVGSVSCSLYRLGWQLSLKTQGLTAFLTLGAPIRKIDLVRSLSIYFWPIVFWTSVAFE